MANEMKTICQSKEPEVPIADCGLRTADRRNEFGEMDAKGGKKNCINEIIGFQQSGIRNWALFFLSAIRNPQSEIGNRLLPEGVIAKNQRGHRFDDWHGARQDTGIMASARG